jgi:hypothetical protein
MTASLDKLYDKACGHFDGDQEMMNRVRKAYLQDQRYMITFVRILLVPRSASLSNERVCGKHESGSLLRCDTRERILQQPISMTKSCPAWT